jgi:hypothetical protein
MASPRYGSGPQLNRQLVLAIFNAVTDGSVVGPHPVIAERAQDGVLETGGTGKINNPDRQMMQHC